MNTTRTELTLGDSGPRSLDPHVREVLRSAELELRGLLRQRMEIMKRIGTIRQTVAGLVSVFENVTVDDDLMCLLGRATSKRRTGFTRCCRSVLMEAQRPLTAREVCQELDRKFPDALARHKDRLASVTTVLTRLVEYAEAECLLNRDGKRVWLWAADRQQERESTQNDHTGGTSS